MTGKISFQNRRYHYYSTLLILAMVTLMSIGIALVSWIHYDAYIQEQKLRLTEMVKQEAMLMNAIARFDAVYSQNDHPKGASAATFSQIVDAMRHYDYSTTAGESVIARREGEKLIYKLRQYQGSIDTNEYVVDLKGSPDTAMLMALNGKSGIYVGPNYKGEQVIAAYEPVEELGLGLVETFSLSAIRVAFINASLQSGAVLLLIIVIVSFWLIRLINPLSYKLKHNETITNTIVNCATDVIITINERGIIQQANHSCELLLGYRPDELIGKNINILLPQNLAAKHDVYVNRAVNKQKVGELLPTRDLVAIHKSGQEVPINLSLSRGEYPGGVIFTGIIRDMTATKKNEQELMQAKNVAETANKAKSIFISNMSHELRTPLNAILGFSQLIEDDEKLTEDVREQIKEISNAGNYLLDLINDLLDLSKIEANKLNVIKEEFLVTECLCECFRLMKVMAEKAGITLEEDFETVDYVVNLDIRRFKQVIVNLLSNAIKYNQHNGKVTIRLKKLQQGWLRVSVEDTGLGIPEKYRDKMFTHFSRLHMEKTTVEGTGIGLLISKLLIEKMGGSIDYVSNINSGSTFWVDIPYERMEYKVIKNDEISQQPAIQNVMSR